MSDLKNNNKIIDRNAALNFVWKGPKTFLEDGTIQQEEKMLKDASDEDLAKYENHCISMLYSVEPNNLGRFNVKKEINEQIVKCNIELFIREQTALGVARFALLDQIRQLLNVNNISMIHLNGLLMRDINSSNLGEEYNNLPVSMVIDGCLDKLGLFSRKHLTVTFLLKQGIWLSPEELAEHEPNLKNKTKIEKEEYLKSILNVNPKHKLKISSSGLTLAEMREALNIRDAKYSQMSSEKLKLLRNNILFILMREVDNHIKQWLDILEKVRYNISVRHEQNNSK